MASKKSLTAREEQQQLSDAIGNGDLAAFDAFFSLTQQRAVYFANQFLNNIEDARDMTQQAYLETYMAFFCAAHKPSISARQLFWTCLNRRCRSLYNRKLRQQTKSLDENPLTEIPTEDYDFLPIEALDRKEKREALLNVVNHLPESQREVIILLFLCGLSYSETAAALNKSVGTVKAQVHTAKAAMQKEIGCRDQLYAVIGLPVLTQLFQQQAQTDRYALPAGTLAHLIASGTKTATGAAAAGTGTAGAAAGTAATTAGTATAATTAAGAGAMAATIGTGAGVMAKFAALAVGTKALIIAGAVVVTAAGVGIPVSMEMEHAAKAQAAAIVAQQQAEETTRLQAEQAAQQAAQKIEEEARAAAAAAKAAAEKQAIEKATAEAAAKEAADAAEKEKAEAAAKEAAQKKAEEEKENSGATAQKPSSGSSGSASSSGSSSGGGNGGYTPGMGPSDAVGLPGQSGSGSSSQPTGGARGPGGYLEYQGKSEPSGTKGNSMLNGSEQWSPSKGGWVSERGGGMIIYPDGTLDIS